MLAAGIAFYFLLAVFPAIGALISVYGIFSDPHFITDQVVSLGRILPRDAIKILIDQAERITSSNESILSLGFVLSVVLTIYSATKGVNALIQGFNIAYNLGETRNLIQVNMTAFLLTFILLAYFLLSLSMIALLPLLIKAAHLGDSYENILLLARWPLLFSMAIIGLELLYYYGPANPNPRWQWISWGSLFATITWLFFSYLFSVFVTNFGTYNETYGSLGAVVILLLWFWLSALTILLGAEINATRGEPRLPMKA